MLDTTKRLLANQFEAAFCTLGACLDRCPAGAWNGPVANYKFCQLAFHALLFADYYLGEDAESFRLQQFHRDHPDIFRNYEEFEPRPPVLLYDLASIKLYLVYCRGKASEAIAAETTESLSAPAAAFRRTFSRAELHVYNIRHIQHHAAQLSLRLRLDHQVEIPWVGSGWRELS